MGHIQPNRSLLLNHDRFLAIFREAFRLIGIADCFVVPSRNDTNFQPNGLGARQFR